PNTEYQEITIGSGLLHRPRCRTGPSSFFVFVAISRVRTLSPLITKLFLIRARMVLSHSISRPCCGMD
ncbi:unnamed protein product, partial [Musa textilis]